jgi:hypothetical protein
VDGGRSVTDRSPKRGGSIAANDIDIKISISFAVAQHFFRFYGGLAWLSLLVKKFTHLAAKVQEIPRFHRGTLSGTISPGMHGIES